MPTPFDALFDAVREIPASDAAEHLNIHLRRNGDRSLAICPLHGENLPSLTFFEDGHFFCFGCHASGRAIELYQKVLNISALEAARALAADFHIIEPSAYTPAPARHRQPTAQDLKQTLLSFKSCRLGELFNLKHQCQKTADDIDTLFGDPSQCAESTAFWNSVKAAADAELQLYQLDAAMPADLLTLAAGGQA